MIVSSYHCDQCGGTKTNVIGFIFPDSWIEVSTSATDPKHFCCNACFKKAMGGG